MPSATPGYARCRHDDADERHDGDDGAMRRGDERCRDAERYELSYAPRDAGRLDALRERH